jgi:PAS domain S-box-containing protein
MSINKKMKTKARLLVVDDDVLKRRAVTRILKAVDYTVIEAATGAECLRLAQETMPDLVLLDRVLPDTDGAEVCRQVKAGAQTARIFVALMSAIKTSSDSQANGLEAGADEYIVQPIGSRELLARVEAMLRIKYAEDSLREGEEHFRIVADFTHDWEYWVGVDSRHLYVSPSCERVTGYRADEFMQDPNLLRTIVHPQDRAALDCHLAENFESGGEDSLDFRIVTRSGEERWINHVCQPVRAADGRWLGRRASNRDITERVQAEQALEASEERYRRLFENASIGIFHSTPEGRFLRANQALASMLGFESADELISGITDGSRQIYVDSPRRSEIVSDVLRQDGWIRAENRYRRKNGSILTGQLAARKVLNPDGTLAYLEGFVEDITERKRAEEALEQRAAQLALLNDVSRQIAALLDLDSVLVRAVQLVQGSFSYHHVGLFTLDRAQDALVMRARAGDFEHLFPPNHRLKLGQGMVGWAARYGQTLLANDVQAELRYVNLYPGVVPTASELSVPIRVGEEVVGVLDIQSPQLDAFDENDVLAMETLADQIAVAIENARLYEAVQQELAERKRTEEALRRSEELFRGTLDGMLEGCQIIGFDWQYLYVNASAAQHGRHAKDELLGRTMMEVYPGIEDTAMFEALRRCMAERTPLRIENEFRYTDGTSAWFDLSFLPVTEGVFALSYDITERKRAEEALKEHHAFLRQVIDIIPHWIFTKDRQGRITLSNRAHAEALGTTPEEIVGKTDFELNPNPEQARQYICDDLEVMDTLQEKFVPEEANTNAQGQVYWLQTIKRPIVGKDGVANQALGVAIDITERKRAEEKLRTEEERFRLAAECLSDVIYEWDIGDNVQWFGDVDELLGYAPGEFPRTLQAFLDSLHPEDRERVWNAIERHLRGEAAYAVEYRIRHNDGTWRQWLARGTALRDTGGKPYRWIGAVTDITEQKRAEVQLQESEARVHFLADVIEHSSQPFAVGYPDGRPGIFNAAYCNLVGYSQEEMQALDWSANLTPPEWREMEAEHLDKLQRTGQPVRYEKEYVRKDGSRVPIELLVHLVRDEAGAPQYYYSFIDDLTERKRAEQTLQRYSQRLEEMVAERTRELYAAQDRLVRQEKLAILGQLAGGVGHELRNPLGAIKNAAYFLNLALAEPEPEVKETLDILHREVAASERIIGSLLGFARPRPPARQPVEINTLVREALARTALPENVRVVTHLDEALPAILADPDQLTQVFGNLLLNAVQAMPDGGRLTVETRVEPGAGWLAVSIADTGVGVPPENLGKLFEPLFSTKARGIGLGLALSKILVESHGGRIEARSEVGAGSIFTVKLPIDQEKVG